MSLLHLWEKSREQLADKRVHQVIAFAGTGKLRDDSATSIEFRELLQSIPSDTLRGYASDCLTDAFPDSGLALQDIVNQLGRRLGFEVTNGRYKGKAGMPGHDGLWRLPSGHAIIVEVKTTDAYRIDLDVLAGYRKQLSVSEISLESSSMLVVVGRQDTGDLEAQVRGSRHAWDIRLISVEALLRLVKVIEAVEDPKTVARVHALLIPREFTRLDAIVDVVFSTAEEAKHEDAEAVVPDEAPIATPGPKFTPVAFHEACVTRLEKHLNISLVRRTKSHYASADEAVRLTCSISKRHEFAGEEAYWFAFHPYYLEYIKAAKNGFAAFGCGSEEKIFLIPVHDFEPWLDGSYTTERDDRWYWHVQIFREGKVWSLKRRTGTEQVDVSNYLLKSKKSK